MHLTAFVPSISGSRPSAVIQGAEYSLGIRIPGNFLLPHSGAPVELSGVLRHCYVLRGDFSVDLEVWVAQHLQYRLIQGKRCPGHFTIGGWMRNGSV